MFTRFDRIHERDGRIPHDDRPRWHSIVWQLIIGINHGHIIRKGWCVEVTQNMKTHLQKSVTARSIYNFILNFCLKP